MDHPKLKTSHFCYVSLGETGLPGKVELAVRHPTNQPTKHHSPLEVMHYDPEEKLAGHLGIRFVKKERKVRSETVKLWCFRAVKTGWLGCLGCLGLGEALKKAQESHPPLFPGSGHLGTPRSVDFPIALVI